MTLAEGVLNINLGMPVVSACCNSEVVVRGDMATYFKESQRFDFIMRHIRKFALTLGAAVFTLSSKGK